MTQRYALLLDGGFVTRCLYKKLGGTFPTAADVVKHCAGLSSQPPLVGRELLRIYFYDAPPAKGTIKNPIDKSSLDLTATPTFARSQAMLDALEMSPDFAVRRGEIAVRGWRVSARGLKWATKPGRTLRAGDLEPDISQKGVDLRIGLDIARLSLRRLVDIIVVVTGDADLIPAFKFARREGIRLYLDFMGNEKVKRELKCHADLILS